MSRDTRYIITLDAETQDLYRAAIIKALEAQGICETWAIETAMDSRVCDLVDIIGDFEI